MQKDMICPVIVAIAAPAIPISNTKIRMGSRIVLTMAPTSMDVMEYLGLPSASISLLMPVFAIRNGKPIDVILVYVLSLIHIFCQTHTVYMYLRISLLLVKLFDLFIYPVHHFL